MKVHDLTHLWEQTPDKPTLKTLYLAAEGRAQATVFMRTPYNCNHLLSQGQAWSQAGYDVIMQDVRGRYGSDGSWEPYTHEAQDGHATLELLQTQGLLQEQLVLSGSSYGAHCALELARQPLALKQVHLAAVIAMVPALGLWETAHHPDGRPRLYNRIGWWLEHGSGRTSTAPLAPRVLRELTEQAEKEGVLSLLDTDYFAEKAHLSQQWQKLWKAPALTPKHWQQATAPLLLVGGLQDFFAQDTLKLAETYPAPLASLWGDWGHDLGTELPPNHPVRQGLKKAGGLFTPLNTWLTAACTGTPFSGHQLLESQQGRWRATELSELGSLVKGQ